MEIGLIEAICIKYMYGGLDYWFIKSIFALSIIAK